MKTKGYKSFKWQIGYGPFSEIQSAIEAVSNYIVYQKQHHRMKSLKEEVELLMDKYKEKEYSRQYF